MQVMPSSIPTRTVAALACLACAAPALGDGDAGTFDRLAFDGPPPLCLFSETVAVRDEFADAGVLFRGPAPSDGGGVLGSCSFFLVTGISPPTFLGFNETAQFADGGIPRDPQTIQFLTPVDFVQAGVGSFIEAGFPVTMTAFDDQGVVVDATTIPLTQQASPLLVVAPEISRVEVTAPGARWVLDDLLYGESPGGDLEASPDVLWEILDPGGSATRSLTVANGAGHPIEFFVRELSPGAGEAAAEPTFVDLGPASAQNLAADTPARLQQRVQETGASSAPRILVYTEVEPLATTPDSDLDQALRSLDLPYTAVYGGNVANMFIPTLQGSEWDLVIFDHQVAFFYDPDFAVFDELLDHVDGGGRLVLSSWLIGERPDHPLWERLGFRWLTDLGEPTPVVWTAAEPDFFSVPDDVPEFTELGDFYGVDRQRVEAAPGSTVVAAYDPGGDEAPVDPAMILANQGRTLFRGFMDGNNTCDCDLDGRLDTVELWRDVVIRMLDEDIPWLTVAAEGTVPAGGELVLDVGFDTAGLPPGNHTATLQLRSNEAVFSTYEVGVTLEVTGAGIFADGFESGDTSSWR